MTTFTQSIYFNESEQELTELLIKNLPREIKGGDSKENSNIFTNPTKYALHKCNFIHYNSFERISFMIFDFDKVGDKTAIEVYSTIDTFLDYIIEIIGLEPTFITQTDYGYQFAYHLKNHVFTEQKKPVIYLSAIKDAIIDLVGCDIRGSVRNYGIWRNPLKHKYYYSECINYELKNFQHLTILNKSIQKKFDHEITNRQISRGLLTKGHRNHGLFLLGMKFAKNKKNLEQPHIEYYLQSINISIEDSLPINEIKTLAKSIYNNYYLKDKIFIQSSKDKRDINEGVMDFEKIHNLPNPEYKKEVKKRQSLSAERTNRILKDKTANIIKAREEYKKRIFLTNLKKVRSAISELEENSIKINNSKLSRITNLDRKTIKKYRNIQTP